MDRRDNMEYPEGGSLDELYDRLVALLKELPPDRQDKFREKLNSDLQQGRRKPNKGNLELVEPTEPGD